jgi:hypothetical protein
MIRTDNERSQGTSVRLPLKLRKFLEEIAYQNRTSLSDVIIKSAVEGVGILLKTPEERELIERIQAQIKGKKTISDADFVTIVQELQDWDATVDLLFSKDTRFLAQYTQAFLNALSERKEFADIGLGSIADHIREIRWKLPDAPKQTDSKFEFPALEELEE